MPEISVIINCFNGEKYLSEAIDSVFAQTFDDWEIVFWDNASTDGTAEIAKSYGERLRYFRSETFVNLARARNWAFEKSRGNYVAILDSDDIWLPQKLERQLELFQADESLGMVICDCTCFDSQGERYRVFQVNKPSRGQAFGAYLSNEFIPFPSVTMFRKEALARLDYVFDDRYGRVQDYDLCLRMTYNFTIDYVDEPLCKWRMHEDTPEWRAWKSSWGVRAFEWKEVIENLLAAHPDIETKYPTELQFLYKELYYQLGVTAWQMGNSAEARSYLARRLTNKRALFVYLCTFFMSNKYFNRLKGVFKAPSFRIYQ